MFDDSWLEDRQALRRADGGLRRLAEAGARLRREIGEAEEPLRQMSHLDRPRAVIAAGSEARFLRAMLEPVCPVPFVAWPAHGLPGWVGALDLVAVFATAGGGPDGLYRTRQDDEVIRIYLDQARAVGARLILDIQPGRARLRDELRELREWVVQPDVDIAIDPEWNVGQRGVPGRTAGKVSARKVNRLAQRIARTVRANDLPPKLLVVHQFRKGSVRGRTRIKQRPQVQTLLNFDGIGSPAAKRAGYAALSVPRLFDGFSLFYRRDAPLMKASSVLALVPEPDFLLYQ